MLFVSYEFYIKNIYLFIFAFFFLILVKFDKQVDTTDPFNKWVMLGLINLDLFNKYDKLVLTYIVEYLWVNTTWTQYVNTNGHSYHLETHDQIKI